MLNPKMLCKAKREFIIFANMKYTIKVVNQEQGDILNGYIKYLLKTAYQLTEEKDNGRFGRYIKILKGIISQANFYTEQPDLEEGKLVHEWLFMTPNLMFHSFNGFICGLGYTNEVCNDTLMAETFNVLQALSDMANEQELEPKFFDYVSS